MVGSLFSDGYRAFIAELAGVRQGLRITQAELARRLAKPQSYVSKIERLERRLDVVELCALVDALGMDRAEALALLTRAIPPYVPVDP